MNNARIAQLRRFIEEDPADPFPRYALALEYVSQGATEEAVRMLEDLLASAPDYVPTYQQLGGLYRAQGNAAKAGAILRTGIRVARSQNDLHAANEMQEELDEFA